MQKIIDLRSDTFSLQSDLMKQAMFSAKTGDDVYGEDVATNELEQYAATLCAKEAALFTATGTMGNLVSLLSYVPRGGEIILGKTSHIFLYEVGGAAALGSIVYHTVDDSSGMLIPEDTENAIRHNDIFSPSTALICLENTHNLAGGIASPPEAIVRVCEVARKHALPVHLDGARIFNACVNFHVSVADYAREVDSIMITLSKGLGAPAGAIVAGKKEFIEKARKFRKMVGGGMHQSGYMAAMGLYALKNEMSQISTDNANARLLAEELNKLSCFDIKTGNNITNILYLWLKDKNDNALKYLPRFEEQGIKMLATERGYRAIIYNGITQDDIHFIIGQFKKIFSGKS